MNTTHLIKTITNNNGFYENNSPSIIKEYTLKAINELVKRNKVLDSIVKDNEEEAKGNSEQYENEILELIDNQDELTRSDLQGVVTALVWKIMKGGK